MALDRLSACQPTPPRTASEVQLVAQLVAEQPLQVQRRLERLHALPEHSCSNSAVIRLTPVLRRWGWRRS
jgi:hypothetical protein